MIPKNRPSTHPGEILLKEFLEPLQITQLKLAEILDVSVQRINEIIKGKRGITPDTAWLLSAFFKVTPEFWMNLQTSYDLSSHKPEKKLDRVIKYRKSHAAIA
jgi:addiction module HigA family antidote